MDHNKNEPAFLSIREAAARWGVSQDIVYDLVGSGELEAFKIGRNWRITMQALLAYEKSHSNQNRPEPRPTLAQRKPVLRL